MIQHIPFRLSALLLAVALIACAKTSSTAGASSLTVVDAVAGSNPLAAVFSNSQSGAIGTELFYGSAQEFSCPGGTQPLSLYHVPDTTAKNAPLFRLQLSLPAGTINSLFLAGTPSAPDTVFTTDAPPYHSPSDSSMSVRLINLSPGSAPVSVDLGGQVVPGAASLSYKRITVFNSYPCTATSGPYTFEFRDAASGSLLATCTVNPMVYRDFTVALEGLPGAGPVPQSAVLINNY